MDYGLIFSLSLTPALAGTDKGMSGLGLLTVAPAILSLFIGLETAMALLLFPSVVLLASQRCRLTQSEALRKVTAAIDRGDARAFADALCHCRPETVTLQISKNQ